MLDMLKERKAALEAQGKKGFTLMEMLIVIAIIAILIAIAIPIFTGQMDRANASTDLANIRSGYAQVQSDIMLNNIDDATYTLCDDATVTREAVTNASGKTVAALTSTASAYSTKGAAANAGNDTKVGGVTPSWTAGNSIVYTVEDGKVTNIGPSA